MKDIVDRFIAKDADGKLVIVMCIKEYPETSNPDAAMNEIGTSFQTTSGEMLTTSNNVSFRIANTDRCLRRVGIERTAQGVLRVRSPSLLRERARKTVV